MTFRKMLPWAKLTAGAIALVAGNLCGADAPIDLGSHRELFVDRYLVEKLDNASLQLHEPHDEGEVLRYDQPWEGPFCGYCTVIKDGNRFQLYYRGKAGGSDGHGEVTCYAESADGTHWGKPNLGLHDFAGTSENNVMLTTPGVTHNFSPFLDTREGVPASERYKALGGVLDNHNPAGGLRAFVSGDGLHWQALQDGPVITKGAFDSQNVAFWSEAEHCYVCYLRYFTQGITTAKEWKAAGLRSVARSTSPDFIHWSDPQPMLFDPPQNEHIYINQTHPYFRAPQVYIGLAARFLPGRPGVTKEQAVAMQVDPAYFKSAQEVTDAVLLTSRGGTRYDRTFREALLRPGLRPQQWVSRSNYPALNVVQTGPVEMSCYVNTDYAQPTAHLRRYSWRLDGFASVHASYEGGELLTKPITFRGSRLLLNFSTAAAGGIRVEVQDADGKPIPGYALADSAELLGDDIERAVRWKSGDDVSRLAGQVVRLRFVMKEADVFALRFADDSSAR